MGAMEEYQIPAYHLSGTVKALKGGLEDIEMEDQEDPDDLQSRVDAALEKGDIDRRDALDITRNLRNGEDEEKLESIELGGKLYEIGNDDPNDDGLVIKIEKHPNGYFITGGVYSEPEDFVNDPENPREGYGYALTLDGQPMDEDDLEDGLGHSEDAETRLGATNEFPDGEGKYEVVSIGGMHGQSKMGGEKFNSLADACAHAGCDPSEITSEEWIDMEGDGTTLEFMVDEDTAIVMHKNVPAEDAETAAGGDFDHSVVFQLEGPLSMGVTPLERDVNQADAGLASRHEREEANGMVLVSDEDGKCILFYNGEELDQDGLEAAVRAFDAEDGEGKHDDGDDVDERCDYVPCEDGEGSLAEMYRKDMLAAIDKMHKSMVGDGIDPTTGSEFSEAEISDLYRQAAESNLSKFKRLNKHSNGKQQDRVDVAQSILDDVNKTQAANVAPREDEEGSVKQEVLAACKEHAGEFAHKAAGMAQACEELYNAYGKDGDQQRAEIALSLHNYFKTQAKHEENEEELTLESVYDKMGYIKAPVMDENGITSQACSTQKYLTEAAAQSMEENYTAQYLTEQKEKDSYKKSPKAKAVSFKERFQPKTQSQLEELRRYGL
jgi:hypothetical protein